MTRGIGFGSRDVICRLDDALGTDRETWEAEMVGQMARAPTLEHAQAAANTALLDVEVQLASNVRGNAACARIAVFGCLMGIAFLIADGAMLTVAVVDVFAIGACGVLVAVAAGKEAQRISRVQRLAIDVWVDRLLALGWPNEDEGQGREGKGVKDWNMAGSRLSNGSRGQEGRAASCLGLRREPDSETVATRSLEESK